MDASKNYETTLTPSERETIIDGIKDALRELDEEPLVDVISQGVVDKLVTALEILSNE